MQVNSDTAIYMSFDQLIDSKEVMKLITAEVDEKGKKKKIALQLLTPEEVQASKIPSNFPSNFNHFLLSNFIYLIIFIQFL